jgi:hypothetical protein
MERRKYYDTRPTVDVALGRKLAFPHDHVWSNDHFLLYIFQARWLETTVVESGDHHREDGTDTALEILKKRYAKGEITKDEFEQMKKVILSE